MPEKKIAVLCSKFAWVLALLLALFEIVQGIRAAIPAVYFRPIYLSWILVIGYLLYPLSKKPSLKDKMGLRIMDIFAAGLALWAGFVVVHFDYHSLDYLIHGLALNEQLAGITLILLTLELTRRAVGSVMSIIALFFLSYSFLGSYFPPPLTTKLYSLNEILKLQIYSTDGVFGTALAIAAGVVFIYVLWGSLLEKSGAGDLFVTLLFFLTGRFRGGPAKAAVLSSAVMGSISGSAIANTVTTGAVTIPLMKKNGFTAEQAGGIEAAASTGGQIMPPVMGAGAFIMAQFTGVPYKTIVLISIAPAILYFFSVFLYVHILACKNKVGIDSNEIVSREKMFHVLKKGWILLLPLFLVLILLLNGFLPVITGIWGIIAVLLAFFFVQSGSAAWKNIIKATYAGSVSSVSVSIACATAGIIVGVVGQTGLSLIFAQYLDLLIQNSLFLALIMISLVAMLLGMGLPVTASYIIMSVLVVPSLVNFGLPIIVSHLLVFWLSQTSNVTPPIALASFAAAGIAESNPQKTALEGFKQANGLILIPFTMAYTSILLIDGVSFWMFAKSISILVFLIISIAALLERYFLVKLKMMDFLTLLPSLLVFFLLQGPWNLIIPFTLTFVFVVHQFIKVRKLKIR